MASPVDGRVLVSRPDAPWLPPGGRADVVLAGSGDAPPDPTCLVRLLVTRGRQVLTTPRPDGSGSDLPTRAVGENTVAECLEVVTRDVLGVLRPSTLLGYVRNVVPAPEPRYPWPVPQAHFAVWHCRLDAGSGADGVWLDLGDAEPELGERHWWPLVDALRDRVGP